MDNAYNGVPDMYEEDEEEEEEEEVEEEEEEGDEDLSDMPAVTRVITTIPAKVNR